MTHQRHTNDTPTTHQRRVEQTHERCASDRSTTMANDARTTDYQKDEQASDHDPNRQTSDHESSRRTSDMTRTDGRVTSEQTDQR